MKIFRYNGQGGADHDESNFTRTEATVTNGLATITRRMYFEADSEVEDSIDVMALPEFPTRYSAHPKHPAYKYYGNANIKPISEHSRRWVAELEYSTTDPNATDEDGRTVTSETKPWKLRPDNIQFTYPEIVLPFEVSYNSTGKLYDKNGDAILPVKNSAGDKIQAERSVRNVQMSFTFATQNWNVNNAVNFGNSINSKEITVCGLEIPAYRGLLLPPECSYITVYEDNSTKVKWRYWSVSVNIQIDTTGLLLYRRLLDIGDRAKFKELDLSADPMLQAAKQIDSRFSNFKIPATAKPSQICHFRLRQLLYTASDKGKVTHYLFSPTGKLVFCSWEQFIAVRQLYIAASYILMNTKIPLIDGIYDVQCEQDTQMPLDGQGGLFETVCNPDMPGYKPDTPYKALVFREYPALSWSSMNLPKKGIKW